MTLRRWAESGRITTMDLPSGQHRYLDADVAQLEAAEYEPHPEDPP